jgi:hypothetical protein
MASLNPSEMLFSYDPSFDDMPLGNMTLFTRYDSDESVSMSPSSFRAPFAASLPYLTPESETDHSEIVWISPVEQSNVRKPTTSGTTCPFEGCNRKFKRREHLRRHERIHYPNESESFGCDFCHWRFSRSDNLKMHILLHTRRPKPKFSRTKYFPKALTAYKNFDREKYKFKEE